MVRTNCLRNANPRPSGKEVGSEPIHRLAKERSFERFGIPVPKGVYEEYKGRTDDTMMIDVLRSIGDKKLEPEELIGIKHEEFEAIEHMVVPVRGAKEFVLWARTRYRIALATSARERSSGWERAQKSVW